MSQKKGPRDVTSIDQGPPVVLFKADSVLDWDPVLVKHGSIPTNASNAFWPDWLGRAWERSSLTKGARK